MNDGFILKSKPIASQVREALRLAAPEGQWRLNIEAGFSAPWTVELNIRGPDAVSTASVQALLARELGVEVAHIPGYGESGMLVYAPDGTSRWDPLPDDL